MRAKLSLVKEALILCLKIIRFSIKFMVRFPMHPKRTVSSAQLFVTRYLKNLIVSYYVIFKLQDSLTPNSTIADSIQYLENLDTTIKSNAVKQFLLNIFRYSQTMQHQITLLSSNNSKRLFVLHLCVWGEAYADKALSYLMPSLLAPGNIPAISSKYDVLIYIHCDSATYNILGVAAVMQQLAAVATIKYDVVPQQLFDSMDAAGNDIVTKLLSKMTNIYPCWKYHLLGCLQNLAMLAAQRDKAYISFLMPDLLFSDHALSRLFDAIQGKKAAVATAFRSLDTQVEILLKPYYDNYALSVPGATLTNFAAQTMHVAAQNRIVSTKNERFQLTAQLIFHYPQEIVIRALHYHPVLVDFQEIKTEVKFDFNAIDANLLCNIVDYNEDLQNQVWVNEDSSSIGIMEISSAGVEPSRQKNVMPNMARSLREFVKSPQWTELNRYLASKRCSYKYQGSYAYLVSDISDVEVTQ